MRKSLISIFAVMIIAAFISACSVNGGQEGETVNDTEEFVNFSEDETDADNKVTGEAPGAYTILDDPDYTEEINYDYPVVCYYGHDYLRYGNTWSDRDEEWLNENYTYVFSK